MGTILRSLKEATTDLHVAAERRVHILEPGATATDYARYLAAMHGYHAPLEDAFAADDGLERAGFAAGERKKSPWIARDLDALGEPGPHPRCAALPALPSTAHALGAAYVIEGSTLGGRYILSKLPPALAGLRGHATAFLTGYGSATGERWRTFRAIAERELAEPAAEVAAIDAARATFARLITWLEQTA